MLSGSSHFESLEITQNTSVGLHADNHGSNARQVGKRASPSCNSSAGTLRPDRNHSRKKPVRAREKVENPAKDTKDDGEVIIWLRKRKDLLLIQGLTRRIQKSKR